MNVLFGLCWAGIKLECATVGLELKNHPQSATLEKLAELVRPLIAVENKRRDLILLRDALECLNLTTNMGCFE